MYSHVVAGLVVGPRGVEPPSQMTPRLQRESPSEDEPRARNEYGSQRASIAFVHGLEWLEHGLIRAGVRGTKMGLNAEDRLVSLGGLQWHSFE